MLNIVCVNAGNYQGRGAEYVNNLFDMVRRNLAEGFKGKFVCFTDDPNGLLPGIEHRELPDGLKGWWNKLYLFAPNVFPKGERVLYLDLDTLITGRLDEIASYAGEFAILRDFYRPNGWQSSVMAWEAGMMGHIWAGWNGLQRPDYQGGDQVIVELFQPRADLWQELFPDLFVSYKISDGDYPRKASVVVFHGKPRPHEVVEGWVPDVWKVGGFSRAELDAVCNTHDEILHEHIRHACSLKLPTLAPAPDHNGHVCIIGGGPWLPDALDEIKAMQGFGHKIWATNNSHDWLIELGIIPDACWFLDARESNVRFAANARSGVKYYVASQCHPKLFGALHGFDVTLYHNATVGAQEVIEAATDGDIHLVGGGTTVGMKALAAARFMGFKAFHFYGMDSCYREGAGHAYHQPENDNDRVMDVLAYGRKFKCAPWMVTQSEDFAEMVSMLVEQDCLLTVHGDGLLAHIAREMGKPQPKAVDWRAYEIIRRLDMPGPVGVEVGVFCGDLSTRLLDQPDVTLFLVDSWAGSGTDYQGDSGDFHAGLTQDQQDQCYRKTFERVAKYGKRARIVRKPSVEAARDFEDGSLDFAFIDADHSYEGCKADIAAWWPKVRPGGVFGGHDYANAEFPGFGVTQAVNEFAKGMDLELGNNYCWFVRKGAA